MKSNFIYILPILVLSACNHSGKSAAGASDAELRQKLPGRWKADSQLPGGIHFQSEKIVDSAGGYVENITNTLADGMRTAIVAGTLQVNEGLLIDTITNDLTGNTVVPRISDVAKIIRLDEHELTVRSTNNDVTYTYQKTGR